MKNKRYFLVGMPASGKSSVGRLLAKQLRLKFDDLDDIIVEKQGMPITDIFESKGEPYFRELEKDCLYKYIEQEDNYILATGGGAPCFFDNMKLMNKHGITIFLDVKIEDLYQKLLIKGTHKRPLLKGKSPQKLRQELFDKYEYRKTFYNQSRICLQQRLSDKNERVNQVIFAISTLKE
jgi:shikimate kinase